MDDLDKGSAPGSVEMVSAKRTASFDEDCEDEMALFARHDKALDLEERRKKPLLQRLFIPLLAVLIVLIVVVAVLSGVFSTSRGSGLEDCTPQKVEVPDVVTMTLAEKVGQMMQIDQLALQDPADVANYFMGSILSGGGGAPRWGNKPADWADMVDDLQAQVAKTRLKIPIVYGADAVHGHNNVHGATIFPHHVAMGATRNPQLMQRVAASTAKEVAGTGVRWTFSPAVTVCLDPRWGRCYESFSSTTNIVTIMSLPEILGFQTLPEDRPKVDDWTEDTVFIASTAKHFVGDGGTTGGKDRGNTECAEAELREVHLAPYVTAINSGVASIMVSYSSWNGEQMHGNKYLLTDILRTELGFKGVVVSDWAAIQLLPGNFSDQVTKSVMAGIDMIMVPTDYKLFAATLTDLVERGAVPMERINEAVGRILAMKKSLGLFEDACAKRDFLQYVGSDEHRKTAREAVRESLVLLKNADRRQEGTPIFPLQVEGKKILILGRHANDIGLQCGGWTITWQGSAGRSTKGTTIFEGFQEVLGSASPGAQVVYQETYNGAEEADYAIIFVGEFPYAEYGGDSATLGINGTDTSMIEEVCGRMPCVLVLITGRALVVQPLLAKVDALIAAWLPGSEGAGVADVIVGDHDFKGRLPFHWFKSVDDLPITPATQSDVLFNYGYGLDKAGQVVLGFP